MRVSRERERERRERESIERERRGGGINFSVTTFSNLLPASNRDLTKMRTRRG